MHVIVTCESVFGGWAYRITGDNKSPHFNVQTRDESQPKIGQWSTLRKVTKNQYEEFMDDNQRRPDVIALHHFAYENYDPYRSHD